MFQIKKLTTLVILTLLLQPAFAQQKLVGPGLAIDPYHYTIQKEITVKNAAVVTAYPLASEVGLAILKQGGNAVDAAIAAQLALAVVFPAAGNIGGGGFMVIHLKNGKNTTIDFREEAPGAAFRNMFLDKNGNADPNLSINSRLSSGIPGTVAGLFKAHEYGKLPFRDLIQPAIDLAENGFVITQQQANMLNENQADFLKYNKAPVPFVRPGGWHAGDTLIQKDLANTLKFIRDKGAAGFYEGITAQRIVAEMKRGNGIITLEDLKNYRAKERAPVLFNYHGYEVETMPLPSSGGIMLEQMFGILEHYPVSRWGFESVKSVQLMTEIERRCYADRAQYLGDPDFVKVPVKAITSQSYLLNRMKDYSPDSASPSQTIHAGIIRPEDEETTHLCVLDNAGDAVSVTYTLNDLYGNRVVVQGAGFLLNDEMDDFSSKPGSPNMFGLIGAEADAIAPYKRMLSSMTPTIVLKNNRPYLVTGTPGGATIITSVFQTLVDVLDFHLTPDKAVNAPKFHEQWLPDFVFVEKEFPQNVITQMEKIGYHFKTRGSIGRTELIEEKNKEVIAVGDHRGNDSAAGY
jgi:gamma-glutamyltranspeptidase / glutathione hydrolase